MVNIICLCGFTNRNCSSRSSRVIKGNESKALRHMFFAERACSKVDGPAGKTKPIKIKTVGVIGAGLMGGGIAMCCANAGMSVIIVDRTDKDLARGLSTVTLGERS